MAKIRWATTTRQRYIKGMRVGSFTLCDPFIQKYLVESAILYNYKHHQLVCMALQSRQRFV